MSNIWLDLWDFDEVGDALSEFIMKNVSKKEIVNPHKTVSELMAKYFSSNPKHAKFERKIRTDVLYHESPNDGYIIDEVIISFVA